MSDAHLDARQAGRSTKRGRPLGSRDRFPRGTKDAERAKLLEAENAHLRRRLADFEAERAANVWRGDVAGMLIAAAKGEYWPQPSQLYAARIVYMDGVDKTRQELDNHRAQLEDQARQYHDGDARLDKLIADFGRFTADREAELATLLASGDVTPNGAKAIRSWFAEPEQLALPPPAAETAPEPGAPNGAGAANLAPEASSASTEPAARPAALLKADPRPDIEPTTIASIVWAPKPFWIGQTRSGVRYEADSSSCVEVNDPDDRKDLLLMGCRERR